MKGDNSPVAPVSPSAHQPEPTNSWRSGEETFGGFPWCPVTDSPLWEQVGPRVWDAGKGNGACSIAQSVLYGRTRLKQHALYDLRPSGLHFRPTQLLPRENFNSPAAPLSGWVISKQGVGIGSPFGLWVLAMASGPSAPQRKLAFESLCVSRDSLSIGTNWGSVCVVGGRLTSTHKTQPLLST